MIDKIVIISALVIGYGYNLYLTKRAGKPLVSEFNVITGLVSLAVAIGVALG